MIPIPARSFATELLARDLPSLPAERLSATVAFVERRLSTLAGPMSLGVAAVAAGVAVLGRAVGTTRTVRWIGHRPLPVVGDYVRLLRSLAFSFVWETWPDTGPDGAPR